MKPTQYFRVESRKRIPPRYAKSRQLTSHGSVVPGERGQCRKNYADRRSFGEAALLLGEPWDRLSPSNSQETPENPKQQRAHRILPQTSVIAKRPAHHEP